MPGSKMSIVYAADANESMTMTARHGLIGLAKVVAKGGVHGVPANVMPRVAEAAT